MSRELSASDFWKNFRLGEEIHIAGAFIYNGLRKFHELTQFDHVDELFECLYDLSVGIERLLKTAVVLFEHTDKSDQDELEKSLITHSHQDLLTRLRKHVEVNFAPTHNDLLSLLGSFYKTLRYDRFSLTSVYKGKKEADALSNYLSKHLKVQLPEESSIFGTSNEDRYRVFLRRTVQKVSQAIYKVVEDQARSVGLYTYELRHGSKAESVFLRQVDIADEDVLWKELLVFFMNTEATTGYLKFLRDIPPLEFDPALVPDYLNCFKSDAAKAEMMDELENLYENLDDKGVRLQMMSVIGAPGVYFGNIDDDDEIDDTDSF